VPAHTDLVRQFYDQYGEREWDRFHQNATGRLTLHLHTHLLAGLLRPGLRVLDAGSGAGRFSLQCLEAGATVTMLDLSSRQLELAREKTADHTDLIDSIHQGNIADLSEFSSESFDLVLCYGSVLCYLGAEIDHAIEELARVTRKGGRVVTSVGSRYGLLRFAAGNPRLDPDGFLGRPDYWHVHSVLATGDLPRHPEVEQPARHFFTSDELSKRMQSAGLTMETMGAAPAVASGLFERLDEIRSSESAWRTLVKIEEQAYTQPGLADAGDFILACAAKR